jgi:hypothetical protein
MCPPQQFFQPQTSREPSYNIRRTRSLDGELVQRLAHVPLCLVAASLLAACPAAALSILSSLVLGYLDPTSVHSSRNCEVAGTYVVSSTCLEWLLEADVYALLSVGLESWFGHMGP